MELIRIGIALTLGFLVTGASAYGTAKPNIVLNKVVQGMPHDSAQEIRVLTASFKPGDQTVFHTHRFPVTVYVLEGAFTL
jgi:quercetin dioxygenase-like cupin family protein